MKEALNIRWWGHNPFKQALLEKDFSKDKLENMIRIFFKINLHLLFVVSEPLINNLDGAITR